MAEAQTYLSKCISQKRSIYSNRTVSYVIVLLELLTVLLEYIDLSVIAILISKNSYYYTNILPIMLALCSMLSDTYYAHNYASIIGGSLSATKKPPCRELQTNHPVERSARRSYLVERSVTKKPSYREFSYKEITP